jgi:glutamate 5-kinase
MRRAVTHGAAVVVKVGSSSLAAPSGGLEAAAVARTVRQIEAVRALGHRPVLVSSGAVACGLPALGITTRPTDMPSLQAAAAVGQGRLMQEYTSGFGQHGTVVGQVLLTKDILANRNQYLHGREALARMLALGVVPIVNENDTVVVDELKLGDNDRLAAIVSHLVDASMLVILTDTKGLFSADPRSSDDAELLSAVRHTDEVLDELYHSTGRSSLGSGGVATKIAAARMAAWSGIPTVIAEARDEEAVVRAVAGDEVGTWIEPQASRLSARKLWIAFGLPPQGRVAVDGGAVDALVSRGRSLLAAGVTAVDGEFEAGDAVEIVGPGNELVGKGIAGLSAAALQEAAGHHSSVAGGVGVHRDDLVVLR